MSEEKVLSMEELQEVVKGTVSETIKGLIPELKAEIKKDLEPDEQPAQPTGSEAEKGLEVAKKFVCDLADGKLEAKAVSSVSGSFGYSIPTELASKILEKKDAIAKMRKYAFTFKLAGLFQLPTEGTGVTAYWVGENVEVTESNPTVGKKDLTDYYLAARVLFPRQLLNTSAFNLVEYVSTLCARKIAQTEETAFVAGDGSGKPTGLRTTSGVGSVAQAGANLAYDDVVNLYYGTPEQYRDQGVFLTSTNGIKLLKKLKDLNGLPLFDLTSKTMFGRPVLESSNIPSNLGAGTNETEIWLFDPFYYWIKDGEEMFADSDKKIATLQTELVVAQATDALYTLPEAATKLTAVK